MTRPTPTQGAQSEAARVPKPKIRQWNESQGWVQIEVEPDDVRLLNCQQARDAVTDARATIADLERRLAEAGNDKTDAVRSLLDNNAAVTRMLHAATARADALQARLTEAEQRAAMAERRGFKAGRDAAVAMVRTVAANFLGPTSRMLAGLAKNIAALAPAVPQEGETTP